MNKQGFLILLTTTFLILCIFHTDRLYAVTNDNLVINAEGFFNDNGQAIAKLFREGDKIPSRPFLTVKSAIQNKTAILTFKDLPYGEYAVIVYHDSNSNDKVDHNWMRFPEEQLGFSGGFKISLTSGMPTFKKLKFRFFEHQQSFSVTVN